RKTLPAVCGNVREQAEASSTVWRRPWISQPPCGEGTRIEEPIEQTLSPTPRTRKKGCHMRRPRCIPWLDHHGVRRRPNRTPTNPCRKCHRTRRPAVETESRAL